MCDGEKLLTHLNSELKVLLGLDTFPRVPKKKLNFVDQCNYMCVCMGNKIAFMHCPVVSCFWTFEVLRRIVRLL